MDGAEFLALFYGDFSGYVRKENTTDQYQMELLKDGDTFYANGEKHRADGETVYDEITKECYVVDENGKRWYENEFPFSNIIGKKEKLFE